MDNTDRLAVLIDADIVKQSPEFDPSNYGYGKVGELDIATKLLKLKKGKLGMAIQNLCISATKEKKLA